MSGNWTYVNELGDEVSPETMFDWGIRKYHGDVATGYDKKRDSSPKWAAEQEIIEGILGHMKDGSQVLDVPVGTGRFIDCYAAKKFEVTAVDVSRDMMSEASNKTLEHGDMDIIFIQGDVRDLKFDDNKFDASLMIRLTRWLDPAGRKQALKHLQRVTRREIVFTARVRNHPHAFSYEAINECIEEDWELTEDIQIGEDEDYRVIVLETR